MRYNFADTQIDTVALELRQAGVVRSVEPKVYEILRVLIENRHRVMSRDELVEEVWRGRIVSDSAIAGCIKAARQAIGDDGKEQRLIRTMNRRGYRFVGEVSTIDESTAFEEAPVEDAPAKELPVVVDTGIGREQIERYDLPSTLDGRPSIAVLPFEMHLGFERFPMLADAIAHDINRGLSRLRWLRVIASASAFKFRGAEVSIDTANRALGARYYLTGSLEPHGTILLLSVELVDSRDMNIVWAESFEGSIDDIDALRSEVTGKTIAMAELQIPPSEARVARLRSPEDLDAWAAFYLGLVNVYRFTPEGTRDSIALFQRAIKLEPGLARAHAALSFAHFQDAFNRYPGVDGKKSAGWATACAERSLELDEFDPFCNFVRGRVSWLTAEVGQSLDWLDRATQINPNFAQGFYSRALAAVLTGDPYDVHGAAERAMALSPLDPLMYGFQGIRAFQFMAAQDYEAARIWADKSAGGPGSLVVMDLAAVAANTLAGDEKAAARWAKRARSRRSDITQELFFHALPFQDGPLRAALSKALASKGF